ncbi:MAG: tRNA-uridine aminocarboxypropyltransferase, partial [Myxococcota bacterium]
GLRHGLCLPFDGAPWGTGHGRRCLRCRMLVERCLCARLPTMQTQTSIAIVGHTFELSQTTNTAHLARLMLPQLQLRVRGRKDEPVASFPPDGRTLVMFPDSDADELTAFDAHRDPRPLTLVFIDGTWPQARRAMRREPALAALPRCRLPDGPPTRFLLRRQTRTDQHLCTLEAIARALGVIEGHQVERTLLAGLDLFVQQILVTRGRWTGAQAISPDVAERLSTL